MEMSNRVLRRSLLENLPKAFQLEVSVVGQDAFPSRRIVCLEMQSVRLYPYPHVFRKGPRRKETTRDSVAGRGPLDWPAAGAP